jgi:proteasome lid subunit RPN8/RPN11
VLAEELIVAPGATYGPDSSSFQDWLMPMGSNVVASVHSHPDDEPLPSEEDLEFFGHHAPFHMIAASPYRLRDVRVYNAQGESVPFEIVP